MKQEVKNYLVSLKDRTLGITLARRYEKESWVEVEGDAAFTGVQNELIAPLTMEVYSWMEDFSRRPENINLSERRRLTYIALGVTVLLGAAAVDAVGDLASLAVGMVHGPVEGVLFKGAINVGTHVMVDAIKYGAHHLPNYRGISMAAV